MVCDVTVAVLFTDVVNEAGTVTTTVTARVVPSGGMSPTPQVIVAPTVPAGGAVHVPLALVTVLNTRGDGSVSVMETDRATDGPLLVALNVNVIGEPGVACAGDAVFVMATSTLATTVVDAVAALFAGFGSDVVDDPLTVFENGPVDALAGTVPVRTTVAVAPGAKVPNEQLTVGPGG